MISSISTEGAKVAYSTTLPLCMRAAVEKVPVVQKLECCRTE